MSGHPLWTKSSITAAASVCVCQPVVVQKHFHSKSSFLLYVCYWDSFILQRKFCFWEEKITWFMNSSYPLGICIELLLAQTQFIFYVLPGASRWSPLLGLSRLHSLLKCLTFLGHSIHRFIFSYLNQLPSSMLVLQHHWRISIFIIQIFQWSLQVKWHWIYTVKLYWLKNVGNYQNTRFITFPFLFWGNWTMGYIFKKIWGALIAEIVSVASQIPKCHILGSFPKNVG